MKIVNQILCIMFTILALIFVVKGDTVFAIWCLAWGILSKLEVIDITIKERNK